MRRALSISFAVCAVCAVCAVGCSAAGGAGALARSPSGFAVRPDIADPACNGGRGVRFAAAVGQTPALASATLPDGVTVVAVSSAYPARRSAALYALGPDCAADRLFGDGGIATIAVPAGLREPAALRSDPALFGLLVSALAPRIGGGTIVAGVDRNAWLLGEVTARGRLDPSFGRGGWAVLPFRGEVTAVVQQPSGRIVVAGDNGGAGCCTSNWAAAVSAHGQLEGAFGTGGRAPLPTGEDSGVAGISLEPDGDILAQVDYGNMGCWGVALAMLTPTGRPVPLFADRIGRFWRGLSFGAFEGDAYIDGDGFTLVGTGQPPCASGPSFSAPSAGGVIARFRTDGEPATPALRFRSRLLALQAFRDGADTVVVASRYADPTALTVMVMRPDGSLDPRFGSGGAAQIRTPWKGENAAVTTSVTVDRAPGGALVVIAALPGLNELQLIRLRA